MKPAEIGNAVHSFDRHSIFLTDFKKKYYPSLRTSNLSFLVDGHPTVCPKKDCHFVAGRIGAYFLYIDDYLEFEKLPHFRALLMDQDWEYLYHLEMGC